MSEGGREREDAQTKDKGERRRVMARKEMEKMIEGGSWKMVHVSEMGRIAFILKDYIISYNPISLVH